MKMRAAVVIASDSRSAGAREDKAGPAAEVASDSKAADATAGAEPSSPRSSTDAIEPIE